MAAGRGLAASIPPGLIDSAPPQHFQKAEEVLKAFYGADWDRVRAKYAERIDLQTELDIVFPEWESVRPRVCDRLRVQEAELKRLRAGYSVGNPLTALELRERFSIGVSTPIADVDLVQLELLLTETRLDVEDALRDFRSVIDMELQRRCAIGDFDHMPIANVDERHMPARPVYATSFALDGWVVSCGVSASENPELPTIIKRLKSLQAKTERIIGHYFADRKAK